MDVFTQEERSRVMSRVRSKNTKPELIVRHTAHRLGLRFRLHSKALPGIPDLVFRKYNSVVFVNGCFWHQHPGCKRATMPTSNRDFWRRKLMGNVSRDQEHVNELKRNGWRVLTIWECQTRQQEVVIEMLSEFFANKKTGIESLMPVIGSTLS